MPFHYNIEQDYLYQTGIEKGIESKVYDFVRNLLEKTDFSFEKIALLADVSIDFVEKIAKSK